MKTGTEQSKDGDHCSGSSDDVIPLSLRSTNASPPSVERSVSGQSQHNGDVVHPAADPTPSLRILSLPPSMNVQRLTATSGEAVQDSSAPTAATAVLDESKRRERNGGEAEALGKHPVLLSALPWLMLFEDEVDDADDTDTSTDNGRPQRGGPRRASSPLQRSAPRPLFKYPPGREPQDREIVRRFCPSRELGDSQGEPRSANSCSATQLFL